MNPEEEMDKQLRKLLERQITGTVVPPWADGLSIFNGTNTLGGGGRGVVKDPSELEYRMRLAEAKVEELENNIERFKKEPLLKHQITKLSHCGKYTYIKKGGVEARIEAINGLEIGDDVLLHPKSLQIIENLGKPPLEASKYSPNNPPNVSWDDICGLEQAKSDMIEAIELPHKNPELFKHYNRPPIKGILFYGPPGCGKTMLAKAAANSLSKIFGKESARTGFLYVKGPEILDKYVGETEKAIREIFRDAKRHKQKYGYPAIVFIDEADAILSARGRSSGAIIGSTLVPAFLTEMDGLEESAAIVIIATNRPEALDPAIVLDGRIDRKIMVTRPDKDNAIEILKMNIKTTPLSKGMTATKVAKAMADVIYSDNVKITGGRFLRDIVNGAMLANCVNIAVSCAIQRDLKAETQTGLTIEDIDLAIKRVHDQTKNVQHDMEV